MTVTNKQSFWEHLDVLRVAIVKIALVTVVFGVAAFFFKEELFSVVLAPKSDGFITYRLFNRIAAWSGSLSESFSVQLINTKLAQQFIIHLKTALCAGVLCASPYILYQLFRFVLPALYENERQYVTRIVGGGYVMFGLGVLISYFLILWMSFNRLIQLWNSPNIQTRIRAITKVLLVPDFVRSRMVSTILSLLTMKYQGLSCLTEMLSLI